MLIESVNSLLNQTFWLDMVLIVNNDSSDGTSEFARDYYNLELADSNSIISKYINDRVCLYDLSVNSGGAGGFHFGIREALELKPDWIWVMDDDAEPDASCLANLVNTKDSSKYSFLAPKVLHYSINNHTEFYHHKTKIDLLRIKEENLDGVEIAEDNYPLEANGFVGPLLNTEAIRMVGLPDSSFFIWWDDTDYTYALSKAYGRGLLVGKAIMLHKDKVAPVDEYSWKTFYGIRNRVRFFRKHVSFFGYIVLFLKTLLQFKKYYKVMETRKLAEATILELLR